MSSCACSSSSSPAASLCASAQTHNTGTTPHEVLVCPTCVAFGGVSRLGFCFACSTRLLSVWAANVSMRLLRFFSRVRDSPPERSNPAPVTPSKPMHVLCLLHVRCPALSYSSHTVHTHGNTGREKRRATSQGKSRVLLLRAPASDPQAFVFSLSRGPMPHPPRPVLTHAPLPYTNTTQERNSRGVSFFFLLFWCSAEAQRRPPPPYTKRA